MISRIDCRTGSAERSSIPFPITCVRYPNGTRPSNPHSPLRSSRLRSAAKAPEGPLASSQLWTPILTGDLVYGPDSRVGATSCGSPSFGTKRRKGRSSSCDLTPV